MSLVETLHREHLERRRRIASKALARVDRPIAFPAPTVKSEVQTAYVLDEDYEAAWHLEMLGAALPTYDARLTSEKIQYAVCRHLNVGRSDLLSPCRDPALVRARHIAMYLMRSLLDMSLPQIGRKLAGRDHTTVLHGIRKMEVLIEADPVLAGDIHWIKTMLGKGR